MARYSRTYRKKNKGRKRMYIISALIIVVIGVIFIYNRDDQEQNQAVAGLGYADNENEKAAIVMIAPEPQPRLEQVPPEPVLEPDLKAAGFIKEAVGHINAKPARIIEARVILNDVLPMQMNSRQRNIVKEQLSQLADIWLFSKTNFPQDELCGRYKVQPGDQLRTISKKFNVPYEILMDINNIKRPESLRAGETIKVINGPFHVRIYRSSFTLDLFLQNTFIRSFSVGLARAGHETPTGLWIVKPDGKMISPTWTDPDTGKTYEAEDPDYPLGSRWIGLEGVKGAAKGRTGFAIHGTKNPDEIGTASSRGCVRLHNGNVVLMYNVLMPGVSQVEIVD